MKKFKLVIFDMDGTLLKGRGIFVIAEKKSFKDELFRLIKYDGVDFYEKSIEIAKLTRGLNKNELLEIFRTVPLQENVETVMGELKKRDVKTGEIVMEGQLNLKNKDVVISDDIIATGGTMATAIKLSKESGANKVYAVATHALLLQQAKYRILNAGADEIIGTDSIDNEVSKVSLAKAISDYLK